MQILIAMVNKLEALTFASLNDDNLEEYKMRCVEDGGSEGAMDAMEVCVRVSGLGTHLRWQLGW